MSLTRFDPAVMAFVGLAVLCCLWIFSRWIFRILNDAHHALHDCDCEECRK